MPTNEILAFATAGGANVESQAAYAAAPTTLAGFSAGVAPSAKLNKVWRQASFMSAALAQAIVDLAAVSVLDDGDLATLVTNLKAALLASGSGSYLLVSGNTAYKGYSGRNGITSVDGATYIYGSDAPNTLVAQFSAALVTITGSLTAANLFGQSQSRVDVTGSRTVGTTYTNSTLRPIVVYLTYIGAPLLAFINGTQFYRDDSAVGGGTTITSSNFVVLPGETYKVTGATVSQWVELR